MSEGPFAYVRPTEEETWRAHDMGDAWDRAEAGEPMFVLLRERLRKAEANVIEQLRPQWEAMFNEGNVDPSGLASLLTATD